MFGVRYMCMCAVVTSTKYSSQRHSCVCVCVCVCVCMCVCVCVCVPLGQWLSSRETNQVPFLIVSVNATDANGEEGCPAPEVATVT